jgi:hypothetical protein
MNPIPLRILTMVLVFGLVVAVGQARAGGDKVTFPESHADGVHYTTVHRGGIREEMFVSREAIEAVKKGLPIPSGTVITLVDYRDGEIYRYVVMVKRTG